VKHGFNGINYIESSSYPTGCFFSIPIMFVDITLLHAGIIVCCRNCSMEWRWNWTLPASDDKVWQGFLSCFEAGCSPISIHVLHFELSLNVLLLCNLSTTTCLYFSKSSSMNFLHHLQALSISTSCLDTSLSSFLWSPALPCSSTSISYDSHDTPPSHTCFICSLLCLMLFCNSLKPCLWVNSSLAYINIQPCIWTFVY
jgi:hypothetical protein